MLLDEVSCAKDLKGMPFSELIEVLIDDRPMALQRARTLIEQIDKEYLLRLDAQRSRMIRWAILQEYLHHIRTAYSDAKDKSQWEDLARRAASNYFTLELRTMNENPFMALFAILHNPVDSFLASDEEFVLKEVENEFLLEGQVTWKHGVSEFDGLDENLSVLKQRVLSDLGMVLKGWDYHKKLSIRNSLALLVCVNEELYKKVDKLLLDKRESDLLSVLHENKVAEGVLLLPNLDTDQDLALFFGSTFHVAFSNVDAYTGALYASEYFEANRSMLERCFLQFTSKELELAWAEVQELASEAERARYLAQEALLKVNKYLKAKEYSEKEDDENAARQAFEIFSELSGFRDADQLSQEAKARWQRLTETRQLKESVEAILKPVPAYIHGYYDQSSYSGWKILEIDTEGRKVLVTTEKGIARMPWGDGTWRECRLRRWLNGEFYATIPHELREKVIFTDIVDSDASGECRTRDKVFLLSVEEIEQYYGEWDRNLLSWDSDASRNDRAWWVRGRGSGTTVLMLSEGRIFEECDQEKDINVRPAMWLCLGETNGAEGDGLAVDRYALASDAFRKEDYVKAEELFAASQGFSDSAQRARLSKALRLFDEAARLDKAAKTEEDYRHAAEVYNNSAQIDLCDKDLTIPLDMICCFESWLQWAQWGAARCLEDAGVLQRSPLLRNSADLRLQQKQIQSKKSKKTLSERSAEDIRGRIEKTENELASYNIFQYRKKRMTIGKLEELSAELAKSEKQAVIERRILNEECEHELAVVREKQQAANRLFSRNASVGDLVHFGHWDQSAANGQFEQDAPNALLWVICEKRERELLMWCVSPVSERSFADRNTNKMSWSRSSVRKWLNKDFVKGAFDDSEAALIVQRSFNGKKSSVFLPSQEELTSYEQLRAGGRRSTSECWTRDAQHDDLVLVYRLASLGVDAEQSIHFRRIWCDGKLAVEPMIWIRLE